MSRLPEKMRSALIKARHYERARAFSAAHQYSCFLDETAQSVATRSEAADLIVNSTYHHQPDSEAPAEILQSDVPLDAFLRGKPLVWVKDPGPELWFPFWARGDWTEALRGLRPGEPVPPGLSPRVRHSLVAASILVERGYEETRRARWNSFCDTARALYRRHGYVVVSDLLHPMHVLAMRHFYRNLVATEGLPLGDDQVPGRYVLHSELLASYFHPQLAAFVARIAAEPVKPSYVYFASYRPGASLPKHVDREQCEFSISLLADYLPEPHGACGWPLFLENTRSNEVSAPDLAVGQAVFYRGRDLAHYRDPLPAEHQSTSLFFHYVRPDFSGDLW